MPQADTTCTLLQLRRDAILNSPSTAAAQSHSNRGFHDELEVTVGLVFEHVNPLESCDDRSVLASELFVSQPRARLTRAS